MPWKGGQDLPHFDLFGCETADCFPMIIVWQVHCTMPFGFLLTDNEQSLFNWLSQQSVQYKQVRAG